MHSDFDQSTANQSVSRSGDESSALINEPLSHLATLLPLVELRADKHEEWCGHFARTDSNSSTVKSLLSVLHRSRCRHALLVGAKGCGKTAALMLLAAEIVSGRVPLLLGYRVLFVDATNVGPEDSRAFLETLFAGLKGSQNILLLVDGVSSLFSRPGGGTNKPLLRTLLSRPGIRFAGTMQVTEFNEQVANDSLMLDHFSRVECLVPTAVELSCIVQKQQENIGVRYKLDVSQLVADRTIALTSTFLVGETEPARTIGLLERVADQRCFENQNCSDSREAISIEDVAQVLSQQTGIAAETILGQNRKRDFVSALSAAVVGQSSAVKEVAIELELIAAGLNDPNKPATVLMFAGLTGVGKTELAKQIARLYSPTGRLKVYPMGNFTEPHSVSGLIGVPPGYVGHEEGGRLVNDLLADPYSVFLLDEAEKCHPNVWKPFLTLFDEGWILDQRGRKAYGDRAIFILTTNAGDRSIAQLQRSSKSAEEISDHVRKTLSRVRHERSSQPVFPPQFLSLIRRIVIFNPLSQEAMEGISAIFFQRMTAKWLQSRGKRIEIDPQLTRWIATEACRLNDQSNGEEGGRIVQKLISEKVEYEVLKLAIEKPEIYESCSSIVANLNDNGLEAPRILFRA